MPQIVLVHPGGLSLTETGWRAIILLLSLSVIGISVFCLSNGITTVFMHLYYFPIVLLTYHYRWRGFFLAFLLSAAYLALVGAFATSQPAILAEAFYRFLVFCGIAAVIAWLSDYLASTQEDLRHTQEFQESVIANANIWIMYLSPEGVVRVWNNAAAAISGYSEQEILGKKTIWKLLYPDREYRRTVTREIQRIIAADSILENFETQIRCADGTSKTIDWNTRSLKDETKKISGYIAIGRDISATKYAEEQLRESEEKYRTLIEKANEAVVIAQAGFLVFANASMSRLLGIPVESLTGKPFAEFIWPEDRELVVTRYRKRIAGEEIPESYDFRIIGAGNRMRWVSITVARIIWKDRPATLNLLTDITERKKAEEALQESESFNRGLVENLPDYLAVYGQDGNLLYVNPASARALGYDAKVLIGTPVLSFVAEEYREAVQSQLVKRLRDGRTELYEIELVGKGGERISVMVKGTKIRYQNNPAILLLLVDITERKRLEKQLALQNSQMALAQKMAGIGYWSCDSTSGVYQWSEIMFSVFGRDPDMGAPDHAGHRDFIFQEDWERYNNAVSGAFTGTPYNIEIRVTHPDRSIHYVRTMGAPRYGADGKIVGLFGTSQEITQQKEIEETLKKNRQQLAAAMEIAHIVNWEFDVSAGMFLFNDSFFSLYGTTAEREGGYLMSAETYAREFVHPDDRHLVGEEVRQVIEAEDPEYTRQIEHRIIRRDGEIRHIIVRFAVIKDSAGKTIRTFGANQDITERKQMEEELAESRQLFSDIISFLPDPTFVIDQNGVVLAWNHALEKISGIPAEDIIGKGNHEYSLWQYGTRRPLLIDLVLNPDRDEGRMSYTDIHEMGSTIMAQTRIVRAGGREIILSVIASPLLDSRGERVGAIESIRDITRIKETEAELNRLNENLEEIVRKRTQALNDEVAHRIEAEKNVQAALDYTRSVIEANPDLMVVLDTEGKIMDINSAGEKLTGIPTDRLMGQPYFGYLEDDGTLQSAFAHLLREGSIENFVRIRRTDGNLTPLSVHATIVRGHGEGSDRIIVSAHDITKQKHDEEAIRASLDEKVLLLREIHHRVKNNLQIIISLTNLQMRKTDDPGVRLIMAETQNRVRAMSLVHEKLYRSDSLSRIDFTDYTRFLASQLFAFYGMDTRRVNLELSMERIMVDINTAVPLGLIMNELVSNAIKHAFPEDRSGTIAIRGNERNHMITIIVQDTGIGIPGDLDWKNTESLGLRLINSLVDQVGGTIDLDRTGGTRFTIALQRGDADP